MKPEDYFWKQKTGRYIKISQMSTKHIENTISMLRRKGLISYHEWKNYKCKVEYYGVPEGDIASYYEDGFEYEKKPDFDKFIDIFEIELRTRCLNEQSKFTTR